MTTTAGRCDEADLATATALRIVESMPGFAWSADAAGRFTYLSPKASAYFRNVPGDLNVSGAENAFGWQSIVHPDDCERVVARWRHSLRTGDPYDTDSRLRGADGSYRWFRNSGWPSRDDEGRITGWHGTTLDIDEQKRAETALRERERELSQLVDMVPVHIGRMAPDGEPTFFSKRAAEYLGLKDIAAWDQPHMSRVAAIIGASVHPEDGPRMQEKLGHALATGEPYTMKYRLRGADGAYRWHEGRAAPVRDESGAIVQWYAAAVDIDAQVRAEEALRVSEQRLQQLVDTVPVQIWCVTPEGVPSYINKAMVDYIGLGLDDLDELASAIGRIVHPDDRERLHQALRHAFTTGEPFAMQYRNRRRDGVYRWTDGHAKPFLDEAGNIVRWYGVNIDIDDMVNAQETLQERERSLFQLVETLPVMIDCAAPDGEPVYRSRQLREFLGYELQDLDGQGKSRLAGTLDAGVHPDDVAGVKQSYAHSLATGEPYARKHRLRRYDGEYRWVDTRAAPMRNPKGEIIQWNVTCLDIDNEVRAQEELRLARDRLARASQAAGLAELSASIAHEVNQPLAAVVANSHACQRWLAVDPPNLERARITAERIIRDANAAAEVVSRIRALFKQSSTD